MLITVALVGWAVFCQSLQADTRDARWKRVEDAISKRLPRTALDELNPIIPEAIADKAWAEAAKALIRKVDLQAELEGNKPEDKITRMEAELRAAPPEISPILHTILAHWYWTYFQQNRWRFMNRTREGQASGNDLSTWDLSRIFQEVNSQFQTALNAPAQLRAIPISTYDALLPKGTVPDRCRPTLYDFVANEALSFYTAGEQAGARPEDALEISSDSDILAPLEAFLAWKPEAKDQQSPILKAIRLYQDLLRFHAQDAEPSARMDADIARLVFAKNVAYGESKLARFEMGMERLATQYGDAELASMAFYYWAQSLQEENKLAEARSLALRGQRAHPKSLGARLCGNLVAEIEAKSAEVETERVWAGVPTDIEVRYRNVSTVFFRAVPATFDEFLARSGFSAQFPNDQELAALLRSTPALAWSGSLPPTADYQLHTERLRAPESLKPGLYHLIASHTSDFSTKNNQLSVTIFEVGKLGLVLRTRQGQVEGVVIEAASGAPVANAKIEWWFLNPNGKASPRTPTQSDRDGFFHLSSSAANGVCVVRASHGDREILGTGNGWASAETDPEPLEQTIFFTDRAIYRPGQVIQFKGICLHSDQRRATYRTLAHVRLGVALYDTNHKEVARLDLESNDYGSVKGSFIAPRDRLLGQMLVETTKGPSGSASVRVEEYKRPKFQVTLDAFKNAVRLDEKVVLAGHGLSYVGAPVDGAKVIFHVARNVHWPWWRSRYWGWHPRTLGQIIAHGEATTRPDGSFEVEFNARPDRSVPEKDEPYFTYSVHADVTDSNGETRSADRSIEVGYVALQAVLSANDWQTDQRPVEIEVATSSLDGEPRPTEGKIVIHALAAPAAVHRAPLTARGPRWDNGGQPEWAQTNDLANPTNWPLGRTVAERPFSTDKEGKAKLTVKLARGFYRADVETRDGFGKPVTGRLLIRVLRPEDKELGLAVPSLVAMPTNSVEPGRNFTALWGTGYRKGRALIEIEHRDRIIRRFWTDPQVTQSVLSQPVTEAMRGGFTLHVTQVRENRAYLESRSIDVPWSNKKLSVRWERFRSKLAPGQKETWTAVVTGPDSHGVVAEMIATLYDAALDAFAPHQWLALSLFWQDTSSGIYSFENWLEPLGIVKNDWNVRSQPVSVTYRSFPQQLIWTRGPRRLAFRGEASPPTMALSPMASAPSPMSAADAGMAGRSAKVGLEEMRLTSTLSAGSPPVTPSGAAPPGSVPSPQTKAPDLNSISPRANLNETAFFFPQLVSDTNGEVRLAFSMPEALTEWRFMGLAHDRACRSGLIEARAVTAKDLMVQPNPPRFFREGDVLEFSVKVLNQADHPQRGRVRLQLTDALKEQSADALLRNNAPEQNFEIPAKQSRSFSWKLSVPDGMSILGYKAVAATDTLSDGEEGIVPVLSRRVLLTESLPLPIQGPGKREFEFTRLLKAKQSESLVHQSLTLQMVSNPAWYAVMALPYLMEFPHECNEQTFNRYYADTLARFIANSDPRIKKTFAQWQATPALDSPLEKNEDLKSVMLEETPWLRQAKDESQARRNIGILFDENRLDSEMQSALRKLLMAQGSDGAWPWFPGGPSDDFITLYIVTGIGRLRHLGADVPPQIAIRALTHLDLWLNETYQSILAHKRQDQDNLSTMVAMYLYGRSFFLKEHPVDAPHRPAVDYFLKQAKEHWVNLRERQSQAQIALALQRWGDLATAQAIARSLKERSVTDPELGRFWRDTERSWWWYRAPIETQALMIELFAEVAQDTAAMEECKTWLLKQKQTQNWTTTKATADAVYALLLRGRDLLASGGVVEVSLGGKAIQPEKLEPGTGFYEKRFARGEIEPGLGHVVVSKTGEGVAWGSLHWQYLEDIGKVTSYAGTPLRLRKELFIRHQTAKGPELVPIRGPVAVGDELVVRIELRVDRDIEYVHLKDQRGSGLEPVNVLSGYRYQDGLGYYESTRDTASHFFIQYLHQGTYVFEYPTRVVHRGVYQSGFAEIQCMYAPEFNSHSESVKLEAR